jgi:hypothetical protein
MMRKKPAMKKSRGVQDPYAPSMRNFLLSAVILPILGYIGSLYIETVKTNILVETERLRSAEEAKNQLLDYTNIFDSRQVDAALIASAIDYDAPREQLDTRWSDYQTTYKKYNIAVDKINQSMTEYLGWQTRDVLNPFIDGYIGNTFADIDACLTDRYFSKITNRAEGKQCGNVSNIQKTIEKLNVCTSAFSIELHSATSVQQKFLEQNTQKENFFSRSYFQSLFFAEDSTPRKIKDETHTSGYAGVGYCAPQDFACFRLLTRDVMRVNLCRACQGLQPKRDGVCADVKPAATP